MVNKKWVFPELANEIISLHSEYFSKKDPQGIPLTDREINHFGHGLYLAGWRFQLKIESLPAILLLDKYIPFSIPRIALANDDYFLKWPHVEKDGLLCLRDEIDTINHFSGLSISEYYIDMAEKLVKQNINSEISDDFSTEFVSYWNRWCERLRPSRQKILLLTDPHPPSRKVYVLSLTRSILVCDNIKDGIELAKCHFPSDKYIEQDFKDGVFVWLPNPLMPNQYPKNNANVASILKSLGENEWSILSSTVPDQYGSIIMVFGFKSWNGPAFGGIRLNEPSRSVRPGKKVSTRSKGFRKNKKGKEIAKQGFFRTDGNSEALPVQRIDRNWIFERGSVGINNELESACVGIIGCGSLGSQISRLLIESGIRKLVLIDPDDLSWDNIARHLLGAKHTEQKKVSAIKTYLESQFPNQLNIDAIPKRWELLLSEEIDVILGCDLLISTTGNWDSESALNYAYNTIAEFPNIVYGWTEPYGFAGHALATLGVGGCLSCCMDDYGRFKYQVTQWDKDSFLRRPPACSQTYQPYGSLEISMIQSIIAKLSIDVLLKNISRSQHRIWVGDLTNLSVANGKLSDKISDKHPNVVQGNQIIIEDLTISKHCRIRHKK